jgi:predicted ATPase
MRDLPTGTITLLFTDIERSTHLLQQLGAPYAELLTAYRHLLRSACQTYHGQEVDTQGDAHFAVFSRANNALMAAVATQRALATHAWPEAVVVRARMGLHTGEPSRLDEGYVGLDLHYAARIMGAAHGGQVLLSQTTRNLVVHDLPAGVRLRDLGEHRLKDLERPVHLYQVTLAAAQVADLLTACPQLKVLVTSREVLHVHAEHEFVVPPLALPDPTHLPNLAELARFPSVALFRQRAQAVKPAFQLTTANARAVAEICVYLDGLPLSIELAASHMKLLSPQALLARLDQRLVLLTSGARDAPIRQQTLRNTVAWSYQLLDAWEQRLFRWLSVFVGGWTLPDAEAVCSRAGKGDGKVLEGIAALVDKSLLQRIEHTVEGHEGLYLGMLETIREYGHEALVAHGEAASARQAHAEYFCLVAEEAAAALQGPQLVTWLERLERAHDNIRAALHWALESDRAATALRMSAALERFWVIRGHRHEGLAFLERALAGSNEVDRVMRAKALLAAARLAFVQSNYDRGEVLAQESLALFREFGDTRGIALALDRLGTAAWRQGNFAAARGLIEEALDLFRALEDQTRIAWSLFTLG